MTRSQPPALAMRLMRDAATDPAVIGDLVEAYATGRSTCWFWRQAIVAASPSPADALRWIAAAPVTLAAVTIVQLGLTWGISSAIFVMGFPHRSSVSWLLNALAGSAMTATFVTVPVRIVPSQKAFVAKCVLTVIVCWAAIPALLVSLSPMGRQIFLWGITMSLSWLLGGLAAYWFTPSGPARVSSTLDY